MDNRFSVRRMDRGDVDFAVSMARAHRMEPVFETARIYRGTPPSVPLDRVYGVTTFELG